MIKPVRIIAGVMILTFSILGFFYSKNWLFLTMFIGLNMLQYGFSDWCLMEKMFIKLGYKGT